MLTRDGGRQLAHRHPWLYHYVWKADGRTRETVASDGLVSGSPRRYWHPTYLPRPGHVYLATRHYLDKASFWMKASTKDELYAVATEVLVPDRINPDEDHFSGGLEEVACDRFNLQRPLGVAYRDTFGPTVPSFGTWAEQVGLGSDPAHTVHSIKKGSVAYAGVVPPTALRRWNGTAWVDLGESARES